MARVLSSGTAFGTTTITLTLTSAAGGLVQFFAAHLTIDQANFQYPTINTITDSRSGTWHRGVEGDGTWAICPNASETDDSTSGHRTSHSINTAIRTAGAALQAGDTVTVTFTTLYPAALRTLAVLADYAEVTAVVVADDGGDGFLDQFDQFPEFSTNPQAVLWEWDFPVSPPDSAYNGIPESDCVFIAYATAADSVSGSAQTDFAPASAATVFSELSYGPLSLTLYTLTGIAALSNVPQGGRWIAGPHSATHTSLMCAYRFCVPQPAPVFATPHPFKAAR